MHKDKRILSIHAHENSQDGTPISHDCARDDQEFAIKTTNLLMFDSLCRHSSPVCRLIVAAICCGVMMHVAWEESGTNCMKRWLALQHIQIVNEIFAIAFVPNTPFQTERQNRSLICRCRDGTAAIDSSLTLSNNACSLCCNHWPIEYFNTSTGNE